MDKLSFALQSVTHTTSLAIQFAKVTKLRAQLGLQLSALLN